MEAREVSWTPKVCPAPKLGLLTTTPWLLLELWMRKRTLIPRKQVGRRELPSSLGVLHEVPGRGLGTANRTRHKSRTHIGYWILRTRQKAKASRRGLNHETIRLRLPAQQFQSSDPI